MLLVHFENALPCVCHCFSIVQKNTAQKVSKFCVLKLDVSFFSCWLKKLTMFLRHIPPVSSEKGGQWLTLKAFSVILIKKFSFKFLHTEFPLDSEHTLSVQP